MLEKQRHVLTLSRADRLHAAAHPALEREVVGHRRGCRLRRDGDRHRVTRRPFTALEAGQPFLELPQRAFGTLASVRGFVGPLGRRVEELQDGIVEDPLVGGEGLDVPPHELSQHALRKGLRPATQLSLRRDRPEALGEGTDRGELLTPAATIGRAAAQLLAELLEQCGDVDLL